MNTDIVDKLLRKAPRVRTPAGLLDELQATIELPYTSSQSSDHEPQAQQSSWFRRWMPALGFAIWFLGCVVVFAIQASRITELLEQQRALKLAKAVFAQQAIAAEASSAAAAIELEQLKKDVADVQRIRAEIEQLRADAQKLAALRAQNQQLREDLKSQAAPAPKPEEDFFAVAQARAERMKCMGNLKYLGLASRIWANDSKSDRMPDRVALKAYLLNLRGNDDTSFGDKTLVCPADGTTSYEIVSPGAPLSREIVYSRCPIHNNFGLADGSVVQIDPTHFRVVQKAGWSILERR